MYNRIEKHIQLMMLFLSILACCEIAHAQRIVEFDDRTTIEIPEDKVIGEKLSESHVTLMGFALDKDKISRVINILGTSNTNRYNDYFIPGHSPVFVCYSSSFDEDSTTVVVEADYYNEFIYEFKLLSKRNKYDAYDCGKSKYVTRELSTKGGLKLGINKQQLIEILGPPSFDQKKELFYYYEIKENYNGRDLNVNSFIRAHFEGDKLTELSVNKTSEH